MAESQKLQSAESPSLRKQQLLKNEEVFTRDPQEQQRQRLEMTVSPGQSQQSSDLIPLTDQMQRLFPPRASALPRFSGDGSVGPWLELVERRARHHGWSAQETLRAARLALAGRAKLWSETTRWHSATWEEFRRELGATYGGTAPAADENKHQLAHRRKLPSESVRTYVAEMEDIAARANVSLAEARKYIIRGFTGDIEAALALSFAGSRKEFIEILERYDRQNAGKGSQDAA